MKDLQQKDRLFRHFSAQRWYTLLEVPVFFGEGQHGAEKLITDIDVLALRPGNDLRWELVCGDCKTLKNQSPGNRVLWMKVVMDHFAASSGIIILQRNKGNEFEPDHKLFASSLGITLLDEREFQRYDAALNFPGGTAGFAYGAEDVARLREPATRFPKLEQYVQYVSGAAWNQQDFMLMLRTTLGEGKAIAREIDPRRPEHLALVFEGAAVFAVAAAACAGRVFNQYLLPETESILDHALKAIIWGGQGQYEFVARLRTELLRAKGMSEEEGNALALPRWADFAQLVRSLLEHPRLGFQAPHILRCAALDFVIGRNALGQYGQEDLALLKYSMLVAKYYCRACELPSEVAEILVSVLAKRQSEIVHGGEPKQRLFDR